MKPDPMASAWRCGWTYRGAHLCAASVLISSSLSFWVGALSGWALEGTYHGWRAIPALLWLFGMPLGVLLLGVICLLFSGRDLVREREALRSLDG